MTLAAGMARVRFFLVAVSMVIVAIVATAIFFVRSGSRRKVDPEEEWT